MQIHRVAVVLAGGVGKRVGASVPKQMLEIAGKLILEHTVTALESSGLFDEIIIVAHETIVQDLADIFQTDAVVSAGSKHPAVKAILAGGVYRAESARVGVECAQSNRMPETEYRVFIHDAARPFVGAELLNRLDGALNDNVGAVPALSITDTVVEVDSGKLKSTLNRDRLRRVQTPQAFRLDAIYQAHMRLKQQADLGNISYESVTDDSGLLLQYGDPEDSIAVVEGDIQNIKITTPADLETAKDMLSSGANDKCS